MRRKLAGSDDGDRQMVAILVAVLSDGLPAVEAACAEAQRADRWQKTANADTLAILRSAQMGSRCIGGGGVR